jgi:membrane dipeptidase
MIIVDAHEDIAYNMLSFGRDYTRAAAETRQLEAGGPAPQHNGHTLLGWPDYQRGRVALVFGSLFAAPLRRKTGDWETQFYATPDQAYAVYNAQLDVYHRLAEEKPDKFRLVQTLGDMQAVLDHWEREDADYHPPATAGGEAGQPAAPEGQESRGHPVGLVVLMEGAEGVRQPAELEAWWARGVRIIGPAWAGTRFCGGTREPGPLTPEGYALLEGMAAFGLVLDLSHMDEQAAFQALDRYPGTIVASHANAAALLKGSDSNRFLSDGVIRGLIERDGIVGVVPYTRVLKGGWSSSDGRQAVTLAHVADQVDYICQLAGDARHVGIGSDYDGGFGLESAPFEVDTIADLQKLVPILAEKGYTETDCAAVLGENWISLLQRILPETV